MTKVIAFKTTDLEQIVYLRKEVLHPKGPLSRVTYAKDLHSETLHIGCKDKEGALTAVGTLIPESEREEYSSSVFRLRGMAVKESLRGQGLGSQILDYFIDYARDKKAIKIWCNARVHVLSLYERRGFKKVGETFDVPGSGPHYKMILNLRED